jgi:DNA-binding transcriptional ArsR family regulator
MIRVMKRIESVSRPEALQALAHPLRVRVLERLREPASAATVARDLRVPRQRVNYHLKELAKAQLVRPVGERRSGNFVETLYESVARTFVVSPRVAWADARRATAMAEQFSLEQLVLLGERLQRDAAVLLDRAAFDGEEIASASVEADVRFATAEDRAEFLRAYLAAVGPLLKRYASAAGSPYRVALAVYPDVEETS